MLLKIQRRSSNLVQELVIGIGPDRGWYWNWICFASGVVNTAVPEKGAEKKQLMVCNFGGEDLLSGSRSEKFLNLP